MLTTIKKTSIEYMPTNVGLEARRFINDVYGNITPGYYTYTVTSVYKIVSNYPQLDNWLMNLGANYSEDILIFYYPI